jgi:hypothetical protein
MAALEPRHVHPVRWHQSVEVARETCARFFRDGRAPTDAVRAHGIASSALTDWAGAVNALAELHNALPDATRAA